MISNHYIKTWLEITISIPLNKKGCLGYQVHPGRLIWNLKTTQLKRKIIFQTIIFRFHVNLPGCTHYRPSCLLVWNASSWPRQTRKSWRNGVMDRTGLDGPLVGISCEDSITGTKRGGDTGRRNRENRTPWYVKCGNITYLLVACLERFGLFEVWYFRKLFFLGGKVSGLDRVW